MPIIRRRLKPSDVSPDGLRYNQATGNVETFIDGAWTPSPGSDPRNVTLFPPRATADPRCDAAASVTAAFENQINNILVAIDHADTLYAIAGLILGLFEFGPFAIFISLALALAAYMLGAGVAVIENSLTPAAWESFKCVLYCHMSDNGQLPSGDLGNVQSEIDTEIGGVGAFILNSMLNISGVGGVNNLAALGNSTGDCSGCNCSTTWCYLFNFATSDGGWTVVTSAGYNNGSWNGDPGWHGTDHLNTVANPDDADRALYIRRSLPPRTITKITLVYDFVGGTYDNNALRALFVALNGVDRGNVSRAAMLNGNSQTFVMTGSWAGIENIDIFLRSSRDVTSPYSYSGTAELRSAQIEGLDTNPFGLDNCPP